MTDAVLERLDRRDHPQKAAESRGNPSDAARRTATAEPPPRKRSPIKVIVVVLVAVGLIGAGAWYYVQTSDVETTDDAQIAGNAVTAAPKVAGQVIDLAVEDNQRVKAGDLLLKIDPRDLIASRDQARAALDVARAQIENARANLALTKASAPAKLAQAKAQRDGAVATRDQARADLQRQNALTTLATTLQAKQQALSTARSAEATVAADEAQVLIDDTIPETLAQAQAQVDQAQAQVDQAKAQLATAELNLSYTDVRAPQDGWVTSRSVQVGSYVQAGQSLLSLVTPGVWVTANFKENQLAQMQPGQLVEIKVDAYGGLRLNGHVDSVQMGTGSVFSAFPAENATGNFVKIVQRVPVKIDIDGGLDPRKPLPLGLSVEPTVRLK